MVRNSDFATLLAAILLLATCGPLRPQKPGTVMSLRADVVSGKSDIQVRVLPRRQLIERRKGQQIVNFDLLVHNTGAITYRLVCIRLKLFDQNGRLEVERELNENGKPPALDSVGQRLLTPDATIDIYQPFYSFSPEVRLDTMRFELLFMKEGHPSPPVTISADVMASADAHPEAYSPVPYCLPLHGLVLVHDGHDFNSHHRRFNLVERFNADPTSAVSANLYAYDFMRTTTDGALVRGDSNQKESWLTYGEAIFAPAPGIVAQAVNYVPENTFDLRGDAQTPPSAEVKDPQRFGNYVSILHRDGRVSWLLHMQPGSVAVKNGERIVAGQFLGRVGFSGDSLFPHLHYNVTNGTVHPSQGVPSYFTNFKWVLGSRTLEIPSGQVDTGDLIQSEQQVCR